ncbi:uncharacterized protein METZ01_LOCUS267905, partial [marine metagenome]
CKKGAKFSSRGRLEDTDYIAEEQLSKFPKDLYAQ